MGGICSSVSRERYSGKAGHMVMVSHLSFVCWVRGQRMDYWLAAKKILSEIDFICQRKAQFIAYRMMNIYASNRFSLEEVFAFTIYCVHNDVLHTAMQWENTAHLGLGP